MLQYGGFHLPMYIVNDAELLSWVPEADRPNEVKEIASESWCKALGVRWNLADEFFSKVLSKV